jgi:transcriptional regulator with XRE-family HTH domain
MAGTYRSRRARLAALSDSLRAQGWSWTQIAVRIAADERVSMRVAFRLAHGLSQPQVADCYNNLFLAEEGVGAITYKHISYWESWPQSGHEPSLKTLKRLAQLYQCDVGNLIDDGQYSHLDEVTASGAPQSMSVKPNRFNNPGTAESPSGIGDLTPLLGLAGGDDEDAMKRREFLMSAATFAGLGSVSAGTALEAVRHEVNRSLSGRHDMTDVDDWREIAVEYGQTYPITAPRELLGSLMVDLHGLQAALERYPNDAAQRELRRVGAMLSAFTAQTIANLGGLRESRRWWRTARQAADDSEDRYTIIWIRGREIVRAGYEHRPLSSILQLIDEGEARIDGKAPRAALPEFLSGKAQALALMGESADTETEETLIRLRKSFEALPYPLRVSNDSIFSWGEERLRFTESLAYTYLGNYRRASTAQDRALALYSPGDLRSPAQIELQRAMCLVGAGDVQQGIRHAQDVVTSLPAMHQIRPVADLGHKVLRAIPVREQHEAGVQEYRECLSATFAVSTPELTTGYEERRTGARG